MALDNLPSIMYLPCRRHAHFVASRLREYTYRSVAPFGLARSTGRAGFSILAREEGLWIIMKGAVL